MLCGRPRWGDIRDIRALERRRGIRESVRRAQRTCGVEVVVRHGGVWRGRAEESESGGWVEERERKG